MSRGLLKVSGAGYASPTGKPSKVVDAIARLVKDREVDIMSARALEFAKQHTFETQFQKRVDALNEAVKRNIETKRLQRAPTGT
jgi:hypothetical protein